MSGLQSKFDKISDLRFEPLPTKAVDVVKMVKVGNCTAALGKNGVIYTNAVARRFAEAQPPAAMPLAA